MTELIPREGKPEHRAIPLRLLQTDVPQFPEKLPAVVTMAVDDQALIIQIDGSDKRFELRSSEILRIVVDGWSGREYTATIEYRDPYEVVAHFNVVVGSEEAYWIKAFAKICREKLDILIDENECPF